MWKGCLLDIGGLDFIYLCYDTCAHTPGGRRYEEGTMPWHDCHCCVIGPAAWDTLEGEACSMQRIVINSGSCAYFLLLVSVFHYCNVVFHMDVFMYGIFLVELMFSELLSLLSAKAQPK